MKYKRYSLLSRLYFFLSTSASNGDVSVLRLIRYKINLYTGGTASWVPCPGYLGTLGDIGINHLFLFSHSFWLLRLILKSILNIIIIIIAADRCPLLDISSSCPAMVIFRLPLRSPQQSIWCYEQDKTTRSLSFI